MSLKLYSHLGLGLAGLATALSLNIIYPVKRNGWDRLNELGLMQVGYTTILEKMISSTHVADCVEKKMVPGYADFLNLLKNPSTYVGSALYPFIIDKTVPQKKIKEKVKTYIISVINIGDENNNNPLCKEKIRDLKKLIEETEW